MKPPYLPALLALGLLSLLTASGLAESRDSAKQAFDELCLKIQRGKGEVTEADFIQLLTTARKLGCPYAAAAAVKSQSAAKTDFSPQLQLLAADNALLAGDFRAAATRYKAYLAKVPATKESSDTAARLLTVLIDFIGAEEEAYAFMKAEGAPFRQSDYARKFDPWFLDMAQKKEEVPEGAKRLLALFSENMLREQEKFYYWDYLDWVMAASRRAPKNLYPALPLLNQLLAKLRADNKLLLRYRFYLANLAYKAGSADKTGEALEAAFSPVLSAAQAYFDANPGASALQDIEEAFSSGFQGDEWQICQKAKKEFFVQAFAKLSDDDRAVIIRWIPHYAAYLASPEQWLNLALAYPAAFAKAEVFICPKTTAEVFKKQAPFLANATSPYAAIVKALAAGNDLETSAQYLLDQESWFLQPNQCFAMIANNLWPAINSFNPPDTNTPPAYYYSKFLAKFGAERLMKSPVPLLDTNAAAAFVTAAWEAGDKTKLPEYLHLLDGIPYSDKEREFIFDPAYKAFKAWASKLSAAAEAVAMAKAKIEKAEKAAAAKKAAEDAKKAAEAKAAAEPANAQAQAELKTATEAWKAADLESFQTAGAAADAKTVLEKNSDLPAIGAAQITAMEEAFKAVLDPKIFNPDKAANPLCKNLALAQVALQAKKADDYEKIARQIYAEIKDYPAKKIPFGAALLEFILKNRLTFGDTFDFQFEVLSDQLNQLAAGGSTQAVALAYTTMIADRPDWPSRAPVADQAKIQKMNAAFEKALTAQLEKGQFWPTLFNCLRATRYGNGWQNDEAGVNVMEKLIQQKKLSELPTYRLDGDTAAATLMALVRNEFLPLKGKYPSESYFDDLYIEECAKRNKLDLAYWHYGSDSKGKIVNLATSMLQAYPVLPYSRQAFGPTNELWHWHSHGLRRNTAWRKEHAVNEAERGKLIAMLNAAYGTNRFDEYARGDYYFSADATLDTPAGRKDFFQKLAALNAQAAAAPERLAPPSLEALAKLDKPTPEEINTLLAIFLQGTPPRWDTGRSYELLLPLLHQGLLAQGRYTELLTVIPFFWKMAKDLNNPAMFKQMSGYAAELLEKKLPDIAAMYSSAGLAILGTALPDDVRVSLRATSLKSLVGVGGTTIPVDRSDPRYPIFAAQSAYLAGDLQNAWELYLSTPNKVLGMFKELDPNFGIWLIEKNTETKEFKRAEELSRAMMLWLDSLAEGLDREIQARLMIAYGNIAFARQEFPRARALYEQVLANKAFEKTRARNEAEFRIAEVDRLTKNYDSAIARLEKLSHMMDHYLQTESTYQLALIKYDQQDYTEVARLLDHLFALEPNHADGRLLEGRLNLQLKKYSSATDINVGLLSSQKIIVPGSPLKIKLEDRNLTVAGKNTQMIEVRVWTDSGDEEFLNLLLSADSKTRFEGQLPTALGPTAKGDHLLQLLGNDQIYYDYSEKFRAANHLAPSEPMVMIVASDASLLVSAGKLLSEQEAEKLSELELPLPSGELSPAARANLVIRPGNSIYVRLVDLDKNITPQKDTVTVQVAASSGDGIPTLPLLETATHSGIFEGVIPTAPASAQAYATDSNEERFPFYAISTETYPAWVALQNNVRPKIFGVDLNDNVLLGTMNITADTPGRKLKNFNVQISINGKEFTTVGSWPTPFRSWDGKPEVELADFVEKVPPRSLAEIQQYLKSDSAAARAVVPLANLASSNAPDTLIELKPEKIAMTTSHVVGHLRAVFCLPAQQTRTIKLNASSQLLCFFTIDGLPPPKGPEMVIRRSLKKGVHFLDLYFYVARRATATIDLLCDSDKPPYLAPVPRSMFDPATMPDLASALPQTVAMVTNNQDQTAFDVHFAPETRARVIRLVLADFETDAPAIRKISLTSAAGQKLLPTKADFIAASKNQVLEIVPGDKLSIAYTDDKVVSKGKEKQEQFMSADYNNGGIMACTAQQSPLYRFVAGEKFDVLISDRDCDVSGKQDIVKFTAKTAQGKAIALQALETEAHSGLFIGSVFTVKGKATRPNEIEVGPEDVVIIAYEDRENTDPGIPWIRQETVQQVAYEPPQLRVYQVTSLPLDEKKLAEPGAQTPGTLPMGLSREEYFAPSRELIATRPDKPDPAQPASIISEGPLLIELTDPTLCLSLDSSAEIYVQTLSARKAANAPPEGFDPTVPGTIKITAKPGDLPATKLSPRYRSMLIRGDPYASSPLSDGRFSFSVRKVFGTPDSAATTESGAAVPVDQTDWLALQSDDQIFVGFSYPDAADALQWIVQPVVMTSDAFLDIMDYTYRQNLSSIHVGENVYLRIQDRTRDLTNSLDKVSVTLKTSSGFTTNLTLMETFERSACFKNAVKPIYFEDKAALGDPATIPVKYGDTLTITYTPGAANQTPLVSSVVIAKGADGTVLPFTKQFKDPAMAMKTHFTTAEAFFELAKKHRALDQISLSQREIAQGKKLLEEAIRDYPDMPVRAQADYLLADLTMELANDTADAKLKRDKYLEALNQFSEVVMLYPDSLYAPKAQYKKALTFEKTGDMDRACDEYVKLSYLYPDNELVAETIARLGNYFATKGKELLEKAKEVQTTNAPPEQIKNARAMFKTAADVFARLAPRFPTHELAGKTMVLSGQCYMRAGELAAALKQNPDELTKAIQVFDNAIKQVSGDNELIAEAMYWRGDTFMKMGSHPDAYRQFKKLTWDYPASKWAKFARGRLTEPALDKIMEEETKRESP